MQKEYKKILLEKSKKSIFSYFINNSKIAFLLIFWLLIWGLVSWIVIPKESAPEIDYWLVVISTAYPWASAIDVDSLITQEIENKIKNVDWLTKYSSVSSNSVSVTTVEFAPEVNMVKAMWEVRSKIDEANSLLPDDAKDSNVIEINSNESILTIHLSWDVHPVLLKDYAHKLKSYLEMLASIQGVDISWWQEREIYVDLDPLSLSQYGLSPIDVVWIIRNSNQDNPIWDLTINNLNYDLRFKWKFENTEDIISIPIKTNKSFNWKSVIKLGDIWTVKEMPKENESIRSLTLSGDKRRLNTISLSVKKTKKSDIFKVDPFVKEQVWKYVKENFGKNIRVDYVFERIEQVKKSFWDVTRSWAQSIIIVFLILALFIWLKESLIAWIVIPITFLTTILVLKMTWGNTLNFMTNFSMILSLGILVDTAIVIVEWIHEWIRHWFTPKEASLIALQEFKSPLISWTLTTLAVFIPLLSLPWILWKYLSYIPITVSITLVASLFISLFLVPAVAYKYFELKTFDKCSDKKNKGLYCIITEKYRNWFEKKQNIVKAKYKNFLLNFLNLRKNRILLIYGIMFLFVLSMLIPSKFEMFPWDDFDFLSVSVTTPAWTDTKKTDELSKQIERIISAQVEVKTVSATIENQWSNIFVELFKKDDREDNKLRTNAQISEYLKDKFALISEYEVRVQEPKRGPPTSSPIAFKVIASDSSKIAEAKKVMVELKKILEDIDWTYWVKDDLTNTPWEIRYTIDKDKAMVLWINIGSIAPVVKSAVSWIESTKITRGARETKIIVRYDKDTIRDFEDIWNIQIPNMEWRNISLSQIVKEEITAWFTSIKRSDWEVSITISSDLDKGWNALEITNIFKEKIKDFAFPVWVSIKDAWENTENADLFVALWIWFVTAIFLMFIILMIQFNSYSFPIIILFTIIMSQIWVNIWLYLTWTFRSLAFIIWVISLAWIVVNDAIILVDRINNLRKQNSKKPLLEVIVAAWESRLQPIVLTTLTTAAWVLPLMWVDNFWAWLSVTVIFGLCAASFLTLFVTPALYYQFSKESYLTFMPIAIFVVWILSIMMLFKLNYIWIWICLFIFIVFTKKYVNFIKNL